MLNINYETTLISQLFNSIDSHLKIVDLSMEEKESLLNDHNDDGTEEEEEDDNDDELFLSGHRSLFSSYGSQCRKNSLSSDNSQYEGFHWDVYEDHNYHQITFEYNQKHIFQEKNLLEWSMDLNLNDKIPSLHRRRTSWHEIKGKSLQHSNSSSNTSSYIDNHLTNPLTLYKLFQRTKSKQHPCHLYENFSDKSVCDSLRLSSCSNSMKQEQTDSLLKIKLNQEQTRNNVDQCLQTSIILCEKNTNRQCNNPSHLSPKAHRSLPNLDFLTYYAKENPTSLSTLTNHANHFSIPMKGTLSEPLSLMKKATYTIFYFTIKAPNQSTKIHSSLSTIKKVPTHKLAIKRSQITKTCSNRISTEENETLSSTCSSISSSGYFSNSSTNQTHHIQTYVSPYPLKSCLKRTTKAEQLTKLPSITHASMNGNTTEDLVKLPDRHVSNENSMSKIRRYSAPNTSSNRHDSLLKVRTKDKTCTFSENDLQTKKNVSFCDEIVRRLITPSTSPNNLHQDYCDLIPQELLIDSPPNEFNLSDDERHDDQVINFIENITENLIKPISLKNQNDKLLIDAFANTILHILEIKCNDPKSDYLNNQINYELDRTLRHDLCPLLRELLDDGLRQYSGSLFSKRMNLWRLIDLITPKQSQFTEAKLKAQVDIPSSGDWIEKFHSFIYHLLNLHELASWLTYFISNRTFISTHYESSAFILTNSNYDLFESITNQLEKLSPLQFRLKYKLITTSKIFMTNQRLSSSSSSTLMKKFNVRSWLRDRKVQLKISSKETHILSTKAIPCVLSNGSIRRKPN